MIRLFPGRKFFGLVCICVVSGLAASQSFTQDMATPGVEAIKAAYNQFRYAEVISLSLQSLASTPPPNTREKVEIYTYLAFARVSLGQNEVARKDFEAALELDPKLALDPVYVSPKIIVLFNEVKQQIQARLPEEGQGPPARLDDVRAGAAWRSLVLPGWGQWYKGQRGKAAAIFAVQAVQISTLIYSHIKVGQHHDAYVEARDPADIEAAYKKYTSFYKRRSYLAVSTAAVWLYAHIDAALTASPAPGARGTETSARLQPKVRGDLLGLNYVIDF